MEQLLSDPDFTPVWCAAEPYSSPPPPDILEDEEDVAGPPRAPTQLSKAHTKLLLPLSPAFVKETWGSTAYQLRSGNSVVIMCPDEGAVYKCPLRWRELGRLLHLLELGGTLSLSAFPIGKVAKHTIQYLKFSAYQRPLTRWEARKTIVPFVGQVVAAMSELHASGLAGLHNGVQ